MRTDPVIVHQFIVEDGAVAAGFDHYVLKPVAMARLNAVLAARAHISTIVSNPP